MENWRFYHRLYTVKNDKFGTDVCGDTIRNNRKKAEGAKTSQEVMFFHNWEAMKMSLKVLLSMWCWSNYSLSLKIISKTEKDPYCSYSHGYMSCKSSA